MGLARAEATEGVSTPRGELDRSEVARHLARAAARLFAARGFDATSVREIVEAAEVTKPTLYYHFGSKEGLAEALVWQPLERMAARVADHLDRVTDARELLARLFEENFAFCREDPDRARFVYALFFGPLASSLASKLAGFAARMDRDWGEVVRRLAEQGHVAADDGTRSDLTSAIRGLVVVHTVDYLYQERPLPDELPARLVRQVLDGFGRRPGAGDERGGDAPRGDA
jgi:AcrR family transcriptional regulator